jgi:excisionase family DNA binding protein
MPAVSSKKRLKTEDANFSPEYLAKLKWLTSLQTCHYLQVSRSTLAEMQRNGLIPFSRVGSRVIRFDRLELDRWLSESAVSK